MEQPDPRSVLTRPAPAPDATLPYGGDPDQVLNVRLPRDWRGRPVVVAVHGGFWRPEYDRTHLGPLADDLAGRGWPVVVPEYRRSGWPDPAVDLAAAVAALPRLTAALFAAAGVAPGPGVLLLGHSAGGHLALWAGGADPTPDAGSRRAAAAVRAVLALAPVADLAAAYRADLDGGAVAALLGGGPDDVPARYAEADPLRRPAPARATLIHGGADQQVPLAQSRAYAATHPVRLVELAGVEHYGLIDPRSAAWPTVHTELAALAD